MKNNGANGVTVELYIRL